MNVSVDIRHRLGAFSLDVTFDAPAGITVLYGRSGSGKTSVINAVAGLLRPREGRISVDGRVLFDSATRENLPPFRRRLGYIFQDGRLFPHLSVRRNLLYGRRFAVSGGGASLDDVVDMLGIGSLLSRRPGTLSGGEQARVAIGRALLANPRVILADEPLASLDEARKAEILPCFERLRDGVSVPILYVSHSAAEVARLATTVITLEDGRVVRQGPAGAILSDPSVTPLGAREAGAMIEARVVRHHRDGLTEIDAGGAALFLPRVERAPGTPLRVRIRAHDVILSRGAPEGLSALNVLRGEVLDIRPGAGPGALVSIRTTAGPILARITRRSVAALGLARGAEVHAVVKSVAIAPADVGGGS